MIHIHQAEAKRKVELYVDSDHRVEDRPQTFRVRQGHDELRATGQLGRQARRRQKPDGPEALRGQRRARSRG